MKPFLIFGLLVLIQVNLICGYWYQRDQNDNSDDYSQETGEEYDDNNDYTQNFQDSVQSWHPAPNGWDDDDDEYQVPNVPMTIDEDSDDYQEPKVPIPMTLEYRIPDLPSTWDEILGEADDEVQVQNVPMALDEDDYDYQIEDQNDDSFQQIANIRRRRSPRSINLPEAALLRSRRNSNWFISECTRDECRRRGDGWRGLEDCGPAFCTCQHGNAYLQGCGQGLIYHAEKRLCTWYYNVPGC